MKQTVAKTVAGGAAAAELSTAPTAYLQRDRIRPGADYAAPANDAERRLAAIWQAVLQIDRVGADDDFFALGGDSMQAAALFRRIETDFGLALAPSTILERPTVARLAAFLTETAGAAADETVVVLQREGQDPPLFFFHALGGNVICYRNVVRHLGPGRRMFGIVYPHQDDIPSPPPSIPELAARYIDSIKRIQPTGPYFLIGFSLGGNIAYETARQLRARGDRLALVVLVDSLTAQPMTTGLQRLARKIAFHLGVLSNEPVSRWPSYLRRDVRKRLTGEVEKPQARLMVTAASELMSHPKQEVVDALYAAHAGYDAPPYDGPIKLFRCTQGGPARWALTHLGWQSRALGGLEICEIAANHYTPMVEPAATHVAMQLRRWIDQAV